MFAFPLPQILSTPKELQPHSFGKKRFAKLLNFAIRESQLEKVNKKRCITYKPNVTKKQKNNSIFMQPYVQKSILQKITRARVFQDCTLQEAQRLNQLCRTGLYRKLQNHGTFERSVLDRQL